MEPGETPAGIHTNICEMSQTWCCLPACLPAGRPAIHPIHPFHPISSLFLEPALPDLPASALSIVQLLECMQIQMICQSFACGVINPSIVLSSDGDPELMMT